jgi:hypothetical protein
VNTNISTATEVEAKREPWPELFVGVRPVEIPDGFRYDFTTWEASTAQAEVPMSGHRTVRVFRLPSTADAERAKERKRLSKVRDDAAHAMWEIADGGTTTIRVPRDIWAAWMKATDALAAFDAANAKEQSK